MARFLSRRDRLEHRCRFARHGRRCCRQTTSSIAKRAYSPRSRPPGASTRCKQPGRSPPRRPQPRCCGRWHESTSAPDPTLFGTWRSPARSRALTHDGSQRSAMPNRRRQKAAPRIMASCDADGTHGGDNDDAALLDGKPRGAAGYRHSHEQRRNVVRSSARPAELDCTGQKAADQHVSGHPARRRQAVDRGGCIRRSAHHGRGATARVVRRRFRHDAGGGGSSSRASTCPAPTR